MLRAVPALRMIFQFRRGEGAAFLFLFLFSSYFFSLDASLTFPCVRFWLEHSMSPIRESVTRQVLSVASLFFFFSFFSAILEHVRTWKHLQFKRFRVRFCSRLVRKSLMLSTMKGLWTNAYLDCLHRNEKWTEHSLWFNWSTWYIIISQTVAN